MLTFENCVVRQEAFEITANFSVPSGRRVAVIGPSGAGKSTLLNAIAGFLQPTRGRIIWDGKDMTDLAPGARPCAMLFQDNNLFPHLSVEQNVGLGVDPGLRINAGDRSRVKQAIERVGLAGFEARKPGQLSGGQQGRAALARILVQRKPLILLDEPFSALGPAMKVEMLDLVVDLATETGATTLMVSHDPKDAERFSQEAILVAQGWANAPVATAELLRNPPDALREYLGDHGSDLAAN